MHPRQARREDEVAEAIEAWLERVNRLERHGEEYQLNDDYKREALTHILVGKFPDN